MIDPAVVYGILIISNHPPVAGSIQVILCPAQLVDTSLDHKLKDSSVDKL
jgi:hypothetical protein